MIHLFIVTHSLLGVLSKNKKMISILFFSLFLFAVLRYGFGNDFFSYLEWFEYIKSTGETPYGTQILFTFLNKICPNFTLLLAITSGFYLYGVCYLIKNNVNAKYSGLSFLIFLINPYLFLMNLSAIRQSIAIAIFVFAIRFAKERKIVPYILLIVVACLFHKSAIILMPVYFFANENKVKRYHSIAIFVGTIVILCSSQLINNIITFFLDYFKDKNYDLYFTDSVGNSLRATLLSGVYLLYVIINLNRLDGKALLYSKLYLISMILAVLSYRFSMLTRVQMYFDIFSIVSIPKIIEWNINNNWKNVSRFINVYVFPVLIILIYFLRYYSFFTNPMWQSFTTYQTILWVN